MHLRMSDLGITAVVLAAGASSRMGAQHKLRLPLTDGRSVLMHAVSQALAYDPARCIVVLRPGMDDLRQALADQQVDITLNQDYASGMSSSLRLGIGALGEGAEAAMILLGDQPYISHKVIRQLASAFAREGRAITIPVYGGTPGPPAIFRREVFPELLALTGDEGGRSVIRRDPTRVARVPLARHLMPIDIDTPEDYERVLGLGGHVLDEREL